jgi:diketogulonate reductase-like aldo/keto reductase
MDSKLTKKLNNGVEIPYLGLGVFRSAEGAETVNAVRWAIEAGYVHIDTAKIYDNEKSVGQGVRDSGVAREKLFITTKLWNGDMRANKQMEAFEGSLESLGMEYVDLYLIHWPVENYLESWKMMEKIYASGKAKAVGVSNFQPHHLDKLLAQSDLTPAVNQIELHPYLTQEQLRKYCAEKGIAVQAWSPIGGQGNDVMANPAIKDIAARHGKSPAQVIIRWDLQLGIITIPKSIRKERIIENSQVFDFSLSQEEFDAISKLNINRRNGPDPDNFNF